MDFVTKMFAISIFRCFPKLFSTIWEQMSGSGIEDNKQYINGINSARIYVREWPNAINNYLHD